MDALKSIFELRDMLFQMERDIGLDRLSPAERDVLLAAHALTSAPGAPVQSDQIRSHRLVQGIAQATYHRTLKSLLNMGLLERAGGSRAKHYVVRFDPAAE
ncbi:hypothetical protein [Leisingera caerulea]|uniref:hypothetical protein n=2 Tax=Leisingera caerulea TaxID=506591 RepID=UPI00040E3343|nr:hypothetical protein [Leisingera caerulea]UWQ48914.1 hypothetical protein K3720_13395 [Leisingera caerulea]UWQ82682.1 hypothetical protein K3726_13415 [Leisingera caerulea]